MIIKKSTSEQMSLLLKQGFETFKTQPGIFILLLIIEIIITLSISYIPVIGTLGNIVLGPLFLASWMLALQKKSQGADIEVADLFLSFKSDYFLPVLLVTIVTLLITAALFLPILLIGIFSGVVKIITQGEADFAYTVILITALGILALLVYGVYLMMMMFSVQMVTLDKIETFTAIKLSTKGAWENMWPLTILGAIVFGLCILCVLTLGVGFLILVPVLRILMYTLYKEIFNPHAQSAEIPSTRPL